MKKYIILFIILVILFVGTWLLNEYKIISLRIWGEKALMSVPVLKEYVKTDKSYDDLLSQKIKLEKENQDLLKKNEDLNDKLNDALNKLESQSEKINNMEAEIVDLKKLKKSREERLQKLVQIYEKMTAAEAANIFISLDKELSLQILSNIKDQQAAAILSNMSPDKAAELSGALK